MRLLMDRAENGSRLRVIQHANGKIEVSMSREQAHRDDEIVMNLDATVGADLGTKLSSACFPFEPSSRIQPGESSGGGIQRDLGDECRCVEHA